MNEVTLFRHFGSKYGLLLAVISESAVFQQMGESLQAQANQTSSLGQALKEYCEERLQALEKFPELVRSLVGEAGNYPSRKSASAGTQFSPSQRLSCRISGNNYGA